jgi:hypothetical protein
VPAAVPSILFTPSTYANLYTSSLASPSWFWYSRVWTPCRLLGFRARFVFAALPYEMPLGVD